MLFGKAWRPTLLKPSDAEIDAWLAIEVQDDTHIPWLTTV